MLEIDAWRLRAGARSLVRGLAAVVAADALLTAARVYRLFWYTPLVRLALFIYFFCGIAMVASMR